MKLEKLFEYLSQAIDGKISIDQLKKKFNFFYSSFNYDDIKYKFGDIADKLEQFNEDLYRYESINKLRNEYPDYYISHKELINIIKRLKNQLKDL